MISRTVFFRSFSQLLLAVSLAGCTTIARYDQQAYNNAINAKVSALALMDKATTPYDQNKTEIESMRYALDHGYEYAKGIPKNEITTQQWEIMKNPERNMMGGFLKRWQEKQTLKTAFINGAKIAISQGFDAIIGLETGKISPDDLKK